MDGILFDYGGTLDSDGTTWIDRFFRITQDLGFDFPRPRFDRAFYDSDDSLPARFALKGLSLEQTLTLQVNGVLAALAPDRATQAPEVVARFIAESRAAFQRNRPVLERLAARYRLGVVSNFYGNLEDILASEGLRGLFSSVVDSGVLGVAKPDPAIFRRALADLGLTPEQALMVGDSVPRDMKGAEGLGMRHILVGDLSRPVCCPKALRVASVADLESVLPKAAGPVPLRAGIIAAGDGERLKSSHPETIKPLVPIRGRPLCHWVVGSLSEAGVQDFTVLFNSRGHRAQESLLASFPSLRWTFLSRDTASSWESFRLVAQSLAETEGSFLISTVDALMPPAGARRFAEAARVSGAPAALALTEFIDDEKPLWADLGPDGRVTALGADARTHRYATCGLYYLTAAVARALPQAQAYGRLREYLQDLVAQSAVAGVVLSKTIDVDRPEDVRQAENFVTAFES
ncbi:MAG: HAD-IA family hydrolase [Elusimicrobia bacterium]|nr:HAD-IA family hydrolase [Elusimicrobiota bacterium]